VETVVSHKQVVLESLSYTASEVVGGAGWVEPRPQGCPKAVVSPKCNVPMKSYREGLSRLDFAEDVAAAENKVGEDRWPQRWCASRAKDGGVTVATKMWAQQHKIRRKARKNSQKQSNETRKSEFIELTCFWNKLERN
jgi:hypothetical protein